MNDPVLSISDFSDGSKVHRGHLLLLINGRLVIDVVDRGWIKGQRQQLGIAKWLR